MQQGRFLPVLATVSMAVTLAACSNSTQGAHLTNAPESVLPTSIQQAAKIPQNSLFVGGTSRVSVFSNAAGGWALTSEITDHVANEPRAMGIDPDGDLFVADNAEPSQISLYRLLQGGKYVGALTDGIVSPTALALDAQDDLAVVVENQQHRIFKHVRVFPFAASDSSYELKDVSAARYLLYDKIGDLLVADGSKAVVIYNPSQDQPSQTIRDGIAGPAALAFDHAGVLYVANYNGFNVTAYRSSFSNYRLVSTIPTGGLHPLSLAIMGSHLYIATVSQFKSAVLDYNFDTGKSTRIVDGVDDPFQVMICSKTYLCVANRNQTVTIYQADTLVHTIDIHRSVWSMTTR